ALADVLRARAEGFERDLVRARQHRAHHVLEIQDRSPLIPVEQRKQRLERCPHRHNNPSRSGATRRRYAPTPSKKSPAITRPISQRDSAPKILSLRLMGIPPTSVPGEPSAGGAPRSSH